MFRRQTSKVEIVKWKGLYIYVFFESKKKWGPFGLSQGSQNCIKSQIAQVGHSHYKEGQRWTALDSQTFGQKASYHFMTRAHSEKYELQECVVLI